MAQTAPVTISLEQRLWDAVKDSDESLVKDLIAQGANANFEKYEPGVWGASHRESIIHVALKNKPINNNIVQMLLESSASPNAKYEDYSWKGSGKTESAFEVALNISLKNRDTQLLEIFLAHHADANLQCRRVSSTMRYDGVQLWNPIHTAASMCYPEAVKLLLEHGARVDEISTHKGQSEWGDGQDTAETALHMVCSGNPSIGILGCRSEDVYPTAQILLQHGANVNAIKKRLDCLQILEFMGGNPRGAYLNPYAQVPIQETPLHIALERRDTRLALLLLEHGADVNIPWVYGESQVPCGNLMAGDLLAWLWKSEMHQMMPKSVKIMVKTILLCANRLEWNLPKDILYQIIKYALVECKNDWNRKEFMEGQKEFYLQKRRAKMRELQLQANQYPVQKKKRKIPKCIIS